MITGIPIQEITILQALKSETQEYHERLEKNLPVMDENLTLSAYKVILEKFYGFYMPVELTLSTIQTRFRLINDFHVRLKFPLLLKDLEILSSIGFDPKQLPVCAELPEIPSWPQALGVMYVLEGSTLGGRIISKHIGNKLFLTPASGLAFFHGYGEQTGHMWKSFGELLIKHSNSPEIERMIIRAACETFVMLDNWLAKEQG